MSILPKHLTEMLLEKTVWLYITLTISVASTILYLSFPTFFVNVLPQLLSKIEWLIVILILLMLTGSVTWKILFNKQKNKAVIGEEEIVYNESNKRKSMFH